MRIISLLVLSIFLSACGFKPIYQDNQALASKFSNIKVHVEGDEAELGYDIFKEIFMLKEKNISNYDLDIKLKKTIDATIIQKDSSVTRKSIRVDIEYKLVDKAANTTLDTGKFFIISSYDVVLGHEFVNYSTDNYSLKDNLREVYEELKLRLIPVLNIK